MRAKVDLTNKRFGKLLVLSEAPPKIYENGTRKTCWNCMCDCGKVIVATAEALKKGYAASCGCVKKKRAEVRWARDRSGERYGSLEVIRRSGQNERRDPMWECLCHRCGKTVLIPGSHLGERKDCGCSYQERCADLSGKDFGGITVISRLASRSPSGDMMYLCRCNVCGNEKIFPACTIRAIPKSCGCLMRTKERIQELSKAGVSANIVDGANLNCIFNEKANRNSQTGVRGVYPDRNGTFRASCQVAGELWVRAGFASIASAAAARNEAQKELIEKHNIKKREKKTK